MNKWKWITGISAMLLIVVLSIFAADVKVKYSGPSGQGDLIYYAPSTSITNLKMTSTGLKDVVVEAGTSMTIGDRFPILGEDETTSVSVQYWTGTLSGASHTITFDPVFTATPLSVVVQYAEDPGSATNRIYAAQASWASNQCIVSGDSDVLYSGIAIGTK